MQPWTHAGGLFAAGPPYPHQLLLLSLLLQRLRARKNQDPQQFEVLFSIIEEEVARKDDNHSKSCTKGLLWLKR